VSRESLRVKRGLPWDSGPSGQSCLAVSRLGVKHGLPRDSGPSPIGDNSTNFYPAACVGRQIPERRGASCDTSATRRPIIGRLHPNIVLPALTSALGFGFALVLLSRFVRRRQAYYGVWILGLVWYALAAGSEALGGADGWTAERYKAWYATGAIGVAAYLGAGAVYLHRQPSFGSLTVVCLLVASIPALAGRHLEIGLVGLASATLLTLVLSWRPAWFAHAVFGVLLAASLIAATRVVTAPVDLSLLPTSPDQVVSGQAFDADIRALTPPFNIAGASVLILGAVISALHFRRTRALPERVASNVLIAVGAFVPSLATGLTRFGVTSVFFLGELIGLVCILAGFCGARPPRAPRPWPAKLRQANPTSPGPAPRHRCGFPDTPPTHTRTTCWIISSLRGPGGAATTAETVMSPRSSGKANVGHEFRCRARSFAIASGYCSVSRHTWSLVPRPGR
jgi:hypothetical protein